MVCPENANGHHNPWTASGSQKCSCGATDGTAVPGACPGSKTGLHDIDRNRRAEKCVHCGMTDAQKGKAHRARRAA